MIKDLGVMINCSSGAVKTVAYLKEFIGNLKKMGYTYVMLYTENTYEIEGEPFFGYLQGRYTKAELKEIDAYCVSIGIELIPCIQTLAHLGGLFQWKTYRPLWNGDVALNVGVDRTYDLIEKMIETCAECFTSRRINLGMDEADYAVEGIYAKQNGNVDKLDFFFKHVERVADIAAKYHFKSFIWSDMLFKFSGSRYCRENSFLPEKAVKEFPKDKANLIFWCYFENEQIYDNMLKLQKQIGCEVWFAGAACNWMGFATSNFHSIEKTRMAIRSCNKLGVQNFCSTLWGGNHCSDYNVLPTLLYTAECARGNDSIENAKQKFTELFGEDWDDFNLFDMLMPEYIKITDDITTGGKELFYSDPFSGKFDSTITDEYLEEKVYGEYAKKFADAKKRSKNFAHLFEKSEKYCNTLAFKYCLGAKTRKAYESKDKEKIRELIPLYQQAAENMREFLSAWQKVFFVENKAGGFVRADIMVGGTIQHLESCKARLQLYVDGKIDKIDELEEKLIDYYGGEVFEKRMPKQEQGFGTLVSAQEFF